ncbi:MAG: hypothetical protein KDM63_20375 [Verrucomicrobiae bacterium]|nr:hypothetical protein [Verrucomicrobiae bacterium]MCB1091447.1 hypothetical protein [Verrucomicrobiae bacterium]
MSHIFMMRGASVAKRKMMEHRYAAQYIELDRKALSEGQDLVALNGNDFRKTVKALAEFQNSSLREEYKKYLPESEIGQFSEIGDDQIARLERYLTIENGRLALSRAGETE